MKRYGMIASICVTLGVSCILYGCGNDEVTVRKIAHEEAVKAIEEYKSGFAPEKFGFGVAWEKEFSFAQGNKVGNMIFLAGQLSHDTELDANGMPVKDLMTGKNFEEQLRQTLENMKKVLAHYGATMDDVVFLQHFVDTDAGGNKAGNYEPVLARLIQEYFPKGLQGMTCVEVSNLYGSQQLIESNAIAVIHK
ncbi:RidA family protein [bacterium]|nr:RidA family protein [bacterium]